MTVITEEIDVEAPDRSFQPDRYRFGADGGTVEILGSRSDATGTRFWPASLRCLETGGTAHAVDLATSGTVWTCTFVRAPWSGLVGPSTGGGYWMSLVDLDEDGPRIAAILLGEDGEWSIGDRARAVELPYVEIDGHQRSLLAFERAGR